MAAMTDEDYYQQLKALLPKGPAWAAEDGSLLANFLRAIGSAFSWVDARTQDLLDEVDPRTTVECLVDWERQLGLPDNCGTPPTTLQQRRGAVNAKYTAIGGQSPQYFINVAAAHGYTITITENFPFRFGISTFGSAFNGGDLPFTWQVNAPAESPIYFTFGQSYFGEPFVSFRNDLLECLINKLAPAHTEVIFNYA